MKKQNGKMRFIPVTPAGSMLVNLASDTNKEAWDKLLEDAAHMPYEGRAGFQKRGYTIEKMWTHY